MLSDERWLGDRLASLARVWDCPDRRVIGTLWWYMASSTLLETPLRRCATGGAVPVPTPESTTCTVRADGTLDTVTFMATAADAAAFPTALGPALARIIDAVAAVSAAGAPSLWAIASDGLANRALDAAGPAGPALATQLAEPLVDRLPQPRFVEVGGRQFVRRSSCCLIYETGKAGKCISCPKRPPEERAGLLAEMVRRGR